MLLDNILKNKNEILDIFERYHAKKVIIIGSVSKRQEKNESDIDFVVEMEKTENGETNLEEFINLKKELKCYFERKIDLSTHEQIEFQYPNALKNGIRLCK